MTDKKDNSSQGFEGTRIDLGDDLLVENTIVSPLAPLSPSNLTETIPENIADLLQSAKIQVSEGFIEDAKHTLRRVLIIDPSNTVARQELNRIHELEIKQIFTYSEQRRSLRSKKDEDNSIDSESIMRQLDQDLNLGVFSGTSQGQNVAQLSIFEDAASVSTFCSQLENNQMKNADPQDWIDLGIAFLEMEIFPIAVRLFAGACKKLDLEVINEKKDTLLSATCLLALTLIRSGNAFEAVSQLQPFLADIDLSKDQRTELFYLMGCTYESMNKPVIAHEFYTQVLEIDPRYRDTDQRLRKLARSR